MVKSKKRLSDLLERIGNAKPNPEYDCETVSAYAKSFNKKNKNDENNETRAQTVLRKNRFFPRPEEPQRENSVEARIRGFAIRRTVLLIPELEAAGRRQDIGQNMGGERLRFRQQA